MSIVELLQRLDIAYPPNEAASEELTEAVALPRNAAWSLASS